MAGHDDRMYVILSTPWPLSDDGDDVYGRGSYPRGTMVMELILMEYDDDMEEEVAAAALDGRHGDGNVAESAASWRAQLVEDALEDDLLLPVVKPPPPGSKEEDYCCAVCLDGYDDAGDVRLRAMPCAHAFHEHCIFRWLRRNAVCPLCRYPLPLPIDDDNDREEEDDDDQDEDADQQELDVEDTTYIC